MNAPPRWPLHPAPGELESLSSWLARIAGLYGLPVRELLGPNLGVIAEIPDYLDEDPPPALLPAVAHASGVPLARLKAMTLPGWVPWLFDSFPMPESDGEETFYTYVRQHSVLLAPGEATRFEVTRRRAWRGPWIPETRMTRSCPLCTAEPEPRRAWVWDLPLTVGCTIHRRRLLSREELLGVQLAGSDVVGAPLPEPLATLENYTHQALTTGAVALPGRRIHAGVWFRLLRTLLDELSLSSAALRKGSARTLAQVWETAELTPRAGMSIWQPYERLPWSRQEDLLTAAAVALDLAAHRRLRPGGTLAALLIPPASGQVYPGDEPRRARARWPEIKHLRRPAEFRELIAELERAVRADPNTARQVLGFLVHHDPSPANLDRERKMLIRTSGIPPDFVRTRAETEALLALHGYEPDEIARVLTEFAQQAALSGPHGPAADLFIPEDLVQLRARLEQ
ncbi:TniQ family protein [Nocardia sp. NBC_01730]|uniref:TniQ family protein n=1 Tax=Nocardia sp. NBC_01730 TaxID=2975998 RepID=UPI002E1623E2|nr:TniQ family protein [Nocardia sp. NBC_01730]